MTPERWQQLKELFNDALERAPEERGAFLANACADDATLLREVEALLAECEQSDSPLDSLPGAIAAQMAGQGAVQQVDASFTSGQMLGPYRLQQRLGAGGMGEVFRADDTRLGRPVAVKVLLAHLTGNPAAVARFKREAKAVAALNHPNVCQVYDVGSDYLVLEYVDGLTFSPRNSVSRWP